MYKFPWRHFQESCVQSCSRTSWPFVQVAQIWKINYNNSHARSVWKGESQVWTEDCFQGSREIHDLPVRSLGCGVTQRSEEDSSPGSSCYLRHGNCVGLNSTIFSLGSRIPAATSFTGLFLFPLPFMTVCLCWTVRDPSSTCWKEKYMMASSWSYVDQVELYLNDLRSQKCLDHESGQGWDIWASVTCLRGTVSEFSAGRFILSWLSFFSSLRRGNLWFFFMEGENRVNDSHYVLKLFMPAIFVFRFVVLSFIQMEKLLQN